MALSIHTNIASMTTQRNLNRASDDLSTSMERLSSGLRINSAKDDAAGMQIANRLTSQIKGLGVALKNANDGISIAQTAEAAMKESVNILQDMRELALKSTNGTYGADERKALQAQFSQLTAELTRIAETTSFGSRKLLDGSFGATGFQIGANAYETVNVTLGDVSATKLGSQQLETVSGAPSTTARGVDGDIKISAGGKLETITVTSGESSASIASKINAAELGGVTATARTEVHFSGAPSAPASFSIKVGDVSADITAAATTKDMAQQLSALSSKLGISVSYNEKNDTLSIVNEKGENITFGQHSDTDVTTEYAGIAVAATNSEGQKTSFEGLVDDIVAYGYVQINSAQAVSMTGDGVEGLFAATGEDTASTSLKNVTEVDILSINNAQQAVGVIDKAISSIDAQMADLGAIMNRLGSTRNNLDAIMLNTSASRARIEEVDFAAETANLTKQQTLQQASTAILAQANQQPAAVLKLLG